VTDRPKYPAWSDAGCHPLYYITADGGVLCPKCANDNAALCGGDDPQWSIEASDVNWEDETLRCDNCYTKIESVCGGA
jgi:hypothetical protein